MTPVNLTNKTKEELLHLAETVTALKHKYKTNYLDFVFPEGGELGRDKYYKAMEFFKAGQEHRFRMLSGANGSGKSFTVAVEAVYHWTGLYPDWWEGKTQEAPKHWWIIIPSAGLFKSSMQRLLIGETLNEEDIGTGLIPKDCLLEWSAMQGVSGCVGSFKVKHKLGHTVTVEVKTSEQRRENLQGANLDGVLFDEEPPVDIYSECIFRLRGSPKKPPGISILGFTPLLGLTDVVLSYLKNGRYPEHGVHPDDYNKYVVCITWDDTPHLSEEDKAQMLANCQPNEIEARSKGIPALGSGKIYPIPESQVFIDPFPLPAFWPRAFGLDFGWHCTCALWAAKNPATGVIYVYEEYYQGKESAQIHAINIRSHGTWIPGVCDPSGGGRNSDGKMFVDIYRNHGLDLTFGDNAIIPGIMRNLDWFQSGKLKIFNHLENTKKEYRLYRYDTKNPNQPAANQEDHAMDTIKYLTSRFDWVAKTQDEVEQRDTDDGREQRRLSTRDRLTGY